MAELKLPGIRFHTTQEELLEFYLKQVAYRLRHIHGQARLLHLHGHACH
jgi:hypothetical protein